jgi:hypothetical protein
MPIARYTLETPGVTPQKLEQLARKRESFKKNYAPIKAAKDEQLAQEFLAKYPDWDTLKYQMPEQWAAVIESFYGLGVERLTITEIGYEMPLDGKPRTRQAISLIKRKAEKWLDNPELRDRINKNPLRNRQELEKAINKALANLND